MPEIYDVAIVGSGIAGSSLGLLASRLGCRCVVIEKGQHPRFAIGESTVPTATLLMRQLAAKHDVPELEQVAHYLGLRAQGLTAYPKRSFWFGLHERDRWLAPEREFMFETLPLPIGPDVHLLRSEVDAYMVSRLSHYGVDYMDHSTVLEIENAEGDNRLLVEREGERQELRARLLVDATGHSSLLAKHLGLRERPTPLETNTRTIFGHFRGVKQLDEVLGGCSPSFRYQRDASTQHHCFDGGWMWVIPFDNGVSSVGLMLDGAGGHEHPRFEDPRAELFEHIGRMPAAQAQLGEMQSIRPLVHTGRVQFNSKTTVGPGVVLTPHASGFVDPLFSSGLVLTMCFLARFLPLLRMAKQSGDFSVERFKPLDEAFANEIEAIDLLVSGTISSFRSRELMRRYWPLWVHSSILQGCWAVASRDYAPDVGIAYGAGDSAWLEALRGFNRVVQDRTLSERETIAGLEAVPYRLSVAIEAEGPVLANVQNQATRIFPWVTNWLLKPRIQAHLDPLQTLQLLLNACGVGPSQWQFVVDYLGSRISRNSYHRIIDEITMLGGGRQPMRVRV